MALRGPLAALLVLAFVALASAATSTPIRGIRSTCPVSAQICGLYKKPTGQLLVCRVCGTEYITKPIAKVCDFKHGVCVTSKTGEGKLCKTNGDCHYGNTCQYQSNSAGKYFRCCPNACPAGLCGLYKIPYRNLCGKLIFCPSKC